MTDAAIISGSLVDVRNVGTHKSVKLTIHVPEEHATKVVAAFGWPTGVNPVSVAIARMEVMPPEQSTSPVDTQPQPNSTASSAGADKRKSPAQIAGYLCTLPSFQKFIKDKHRGWFFAYANASPLASTAEVTADVVRALCQVDSRSEITEDNTEWSALRLAFMLWEKEAEVLPA